MANIKINELENRQQITALSEEELRGISGGKATDLMSEAVSEMKTIIQTWEAETKKITRPRKKITRPRDSMLGSGVLIPITHA